MKTESEKITREKRINSRLTSVPLNWTVIPWKQGLDTSGLDAHAVEEYPTQTGPADYALFVKGQLLGIIEAKKLSVGVYAAMEQAKRYAKGVNNTVGQWRGYKVPFLYSTNGELIYHLDIRKKENISYKIENFHSPQALLDRMNRDTSQAEQWFREHEVGEIERLRPYQKKAVQAIEDALCRGKRKMLLAMATGTGKTFTIVSLIYRLMKSNYAKRILFLVDRRALAAQAVTAISAFTTPQGQKLDKEYELYSQKFRRDDLEENAKFNPKILPGDYLTNPGEKHSFIYVSTIQRMVLNLFGKENWDNPEYDPDVEKLDIPNHAFDIIIADECHRGYSARELGLWKQALDHFDGIKIGLTATPASHSVAMFNEIIYSYSTDEAVEDGWLVDYDAVKIKSHIKINGAFLEEGEKVGDIDRQSGKEFIYRLEDEREFNADEIEEKVTSPDSTEKIIKAVKKYTDRHEREYKRFPKILIFAVHDIGFISHADEIVKACKKVFHRGDDFVMKITGKADRPLQTLRRFRNRPEPQIAVTVDMLTTGVDVPKIEMVVFMRMVKSRILWVQMLGRGTRRCEEINKEKFTIVDCFDGSLIEYFKDTTDFQVSLQKQGLTIAEIIERIWDNRDRDYHIKVLIKRLRRIENNMGAEAREQFAKFIENGDMKIFADNLRQNLENNFMDTMKLLRNKEFQDLLVNYIRPRRTFLKGYDIVDTVEDQVAFRVGQGFAKPEDYLKAFETFVKNNPEQIQAIEILLSRPKNWNADALEELRKKLRQKDFKEKDLQRAHDYVYKKPLADMISMIKHAADFQLPIMNAAERVTRAMEKVTTGKEFSPEQHQWLSYIRDHLIQNLAIAVEDFDGMPVFERHGGLGKAKKVFGNQLTKLVEQLNTAVAA